MTRHITASTLAVLAGLGMSLFWTTDARAQSGCTDDSDCPAGFVCEEVGSSGCAVPACPPGEPCPEPEPCVPEIYTECVPGPCATDADCGPGLRCLTDTITDCAEADIACAPGTECIRPEPICEDTTVSLCVPPYVGPCQVDSDCGEGFRCVEGEICECSGSGFAPAPMPDPDDPNADPAPVPPPDPLPEPTCECYPSGEKYCEIQQVVCATDADCLPDWTCEASGEQICTATPGSEPVCEPVVSESYCTPPYWGAYGGSDGVALGGGTGGQNESSTTAPRSQSASPSRGDTESEGGCQMAGSSPASAAALWMLGLLGVAFARRRRR